MRRAFVVSGRRRPIDSGYFIGATSRPRSRDRVRSNAPLASASASGDLRMKSTKLSGGVKTRSSQHSRCNEAEGRGQHGHCQRTDSVREGGELTKAEREGSETRPSAPSTPATTRAGRRSRRRPTTPRMTRLISEPDRRPLYRRRPSLCSTVNMNCALGETVAPTTLRISGGRNARRSEFYGRRSASSSGCHS
jgi:hypothetical protein